MAHVCCWPNAANPLELLHFGRERRGFDSRRLHHFSCKSSHLRTVLRCPENPHPLQRTQANSVAYNGCPQCRDSGRRSHHRGVGKVDFAGVHAISQKQSSPSFVRNRSRAGSRPEHLKASPVAAGRIGSRQTLNAKRRSEACSPSSHLCSAFTN